LHIFEEIKPLRAYLQTRKQSGLSIGLVPTMGALHTGHIELIKASKAENDLTVCSIYVNPTQFNNASDLEKYPRTLGRDEELLKDAGCDVIFAPTNAAMYAQTSELKFDFGMLDKILEGKFRPGHFSGVALVVSKLFNIVQPNRAYFGQKDFQQLRVITQLANELLFDLEIKSVPIVREADGLAMSSRNQRLHLQERKNALVLYESLQLAKQLLKDGKSVTEAKQAVQKKCDAVPNVKLEYIELAQVENLLPTENVTDKTILLIAAFVGEVRLIDNLIMDDKT
jgi:pantoate--beta-alanine ligase